LLLVGYSPRSTTGHDLDIPAEKKNSGELCLWNVFDNARVPITSARTQNVFEVLWHPSQPCFLAATSPCGTSDPDTRTQIRVFRQNNTTGSFSPVKTLDCAALDINDLTIMPVSLKDCYVTASCTDGNTYVWDTARGDDTPIHILSHGESLDNPLHDLPRDIADTGVKFASWGATCDRFYTGSSDGKVKAWDIQAPFGQAYVGELLAASGGVSAGAFSKDFSKLLIGDATGKVHLLGIKTEEDEIAKCVPTMLTRRRPKLLIPHLEPPAPPNYEDVIEESGREISRQFIDSGHIFLHPSPLVGAIQGPNYLDTGLFRAEAHEDQDGFKPLLKEWQDRQHHSVTYRTELVKVERLPRLKSSDLAGHLANMSLDFNVSKLSLDTRQMLKKDRVDLDFDEYVYEYEELPKISSRK